MIDRRQFFVHLAAIPAVCGEFARTKSAWLRSVIGIRFGLTLRKPYDPLGYDTGDYEATVTQMLDDVKSGRTRDAIEAELAAVRTTYARGTCSASS